MPRILRTRVIASRACSDRLELLSCDEDATGGGDSVGAWSGEGGCARAVDSWKLSEAEGGAPVGCWSPRASVEAGKAAVGDAALGVRKARFARRIHSLARGLCAPELIVRREVVLIP
jgi:hypothetical protein